MPCLSIFFLVMAEWACHRKAVEPVHSRAGSDRLVLCAGLQTRRGVDARQSLGWGCGWGTVVCLWEKASV